MDTGRYLCVVHTQASGNPVWKIAANISLTVTENTESPKTQTSISGISSVTSTSGLSSVTSTSGLSSVTSTSGLSSVTSTSGLSSVTSSGTHTNSDDSTWNVSSPDQVTLTAIWSSVSSDSLNSTLKISPVTTSVTPLKSENSNSKNKPVIIAIVCMIALICIVGAICIIRRKRQMGNGSSAPGQRDGDVQLTQEDECLPYSVFPRKEQTDENEHVAYAVSSVPMALSQPRPGEGQDTHSTSASTEHVYCLIDESAVKSDGDKTETQGAKRKDHLNHGRQVETSPATELNDQSPLKEQDPIVSSDDQDYSLISYPETGSLRNTETQSHLEENDPKHGPLKMEENPIYSEMEAPELNQL
ncbi:putative GPI-anchored protein pfl2 [Scyliorhinus canicula]|uniref:putative GPI-anchored protein pfl2 n=1 Tax=Scyliorhinus canicula TaxID=7830 RepID=UPI0018F36F5A|nr:putative GPI-anchored protein pfl2 [Scyliorhinus canicula]XP_038640143.1 putative GPI-anchored protein pfl2 [Scyliorhinus canicula]